MSKHTEPNYYKLLDLSINATKKEILSAYRRKALLYHPDKNPDKDTSELFLIISKALDILTDDSARSAFDTVLRQREAFEIRNQSLNEKRKKFKTTLEKKEKAFETDLIDLQKASQKAEVRLKAEIERIRKEGNELRKAEEERLRTKFQKDKLSEKYENVLKVLWKLKTIECVEAPSLDEISLKNLFETTIRQLHTSLKENLNINLHIITTHSNKSTALLEFVTDKAITHCYINYLNHILHLLVMNDLDNLQAYLQDIENKHFDPFNIKGLKKFAFDSSPLFVELIKNHPYFSLYEIIVNHIQSSPTILKENESLNDTKHQSRQQKPVELSTNISSQTSNLENFVLQRLREAQEKLKKT